VLSPEVIGRWADSCIDAGLGGLKVSTQWALYQLDTVGVQRFWTP